MRGDTGCNLPLNLGKAQCFSLAFHTMVTSRASWYAPPDMRVPNLQLVAVEQLPSIEGAVEIRMDFTFLRGSLQSPAPTECIQKASPMRGSCRRKATDEVDSVA